MFEFERATSYDALRHAWQKVAQRKSAVGLDGVDIEFYRSNLPEHLGTLRAALLGGEYEPYREKSAKSGNRDIYISCIDDKIVQTSLAEIITSTAQPPATVHGFVKKRSIYTAVRKLKAAMKSGITDFYKTDVRRFYERINKTALLRIIERFIGDARFVALVKLLLNAHAVGLSTGSCLSPALSNLYLSDFDDAMSKSALFYSRYVDDILISPPTNKIVSLISENLAGVHLELNAEKSATVNAFDGFRYLGFDVKDPTTSRMELQRQSHAQPYDEKEPDEREPDEKGQKESRGETDVFYENERGIDDLLSAGKYTLAEELFAVRDTDSEFTSADDYSRYISLFIRDTDKYYVTEDVENRYVEYKGRLDSVAINKFVAQRREFAAPAVNKDGLRSFAVFDIDVNKEIILRNGDDGHMFAALLDCAHNIANQIVNRCKDLNCRAYVEFSGYKGYHVWVFWSTPIDRAREKAFFTNVLLDLDAPQGIHIERFPGNPEQKIKLPLSFHITHGKQAIFECDESQLNFIQSIETSEYPDIEKGPAVSKTAVQRGTGAPAHIVAVYENCHIVRSIVDKAKNGKYIGYHERMSLLHVFHCLGEAGEKYLHEVMGYCFNYNAQETQRHIDRCNTVNPIGCKKLAERFEDSYGKAKCMCNMANAGMYPSPIVHAKRVKPDCFIMRTVGESVGHFKQTAPKHSAEDAVSQLLQLNKQAYEIRSQQSAYARQVEALFARNDINEIETPHGLLLKTEQGLFIKVG